MPQEVRRLVFTHPEATVAISAYGKKFNIVFPEGKIIHARFGGTSEFEEHNMRDFKSPVHRTYNVQEKRSSIIITFFVAETLEHKYFNLTADFVSASIIEFCIANKIMLPKNATKIIDITEFNICLDINYEHQLLAESEVLRIEDMPE